MKRTGYHILAAVFFLASILFSGCTPEQEADLSQPYVRLTFAYDGQAGHTPSFAVWMEDESGSASTLFVTKKVAKNKWEGVEKACALPVWTGVRETDIDDVTGATPKKAAELFCNIPGGFWDKPFTLYVEANSYHDHNDFYMEDSEPGQEGFNDVNGQPSIVWAARIDPGSKSGEVALEIAGAGDVLGADHLVHTDLSHVTTAGGLLRDIKAAYDFAGK